ncbi:putative Eukaryotic translation initiation factor [Leptomonas pyrrhocoris]|uniref:Putative Eukaryotic translation initiation factor n=1 Tax=Leptomonas pyrrhocoris TaxID=157538 RepID=A0A0N0VH61_LEPPY|nr:putative Eukaryotic translation initiation factor [Leptomonas pyrrhocoris]KPA85154.1 putative Eukaryotic translation initiation factor [Leptomonas pyrrhocoris]|eukprot:XP_015663593.1 putative Eukaryotic translation initiation factor [Leptomonas pyrrhocoris]
MNPSAAAFVPKKGEKSPAKGKTNAAAHPPSPPLATKLSAAAQPFVPVAPKTDGPVPAEELKPEVRPMEVPKQATAKTAAAESPEGPAKETKDTNDDSQLDWLPEAQPVDWSESKLPKLFGCHNTAAKATSTAIHLHASWDLYADEHQSGNGSPALSSPTQMMTFEPIFVANVADVEHFWRLWRYLPAPSALPTLFTYSWFRKDVRPEWEHPRNKKGGTITIVVFDRDRSGLSDKQVLDDVFMAMLVGAVGESFQECSTTLNGMMLKVRPNKPVTLQLWTAHSEVGKLKTFANSVRDTLSKIMGAKTLQKMEYYSHHQKQASTNSLAARMKAKIAPDHTF